MYYVKFAKVGCLHLNWLRSRSFFTRVSSTTCHFELGDTRVPVDILGAWLRGTCEKVAFNQDSAGYVCVVCIISVSDYYNSTSRTASSNIHADTACEDQHKTDDKMLMSLSIQRTFQLLSVYTHTHKRNLKCPKIFQLLHEENV